MQSLATHNTSNLTSIKTTEPVGKTTFYVDGSGGRSKKRGRTNLEKGLFVFATVLLLAVIGLLTGLIITLNKEDEEIGVCLTEECALAASRVLEGIDQSVNPCDDFYMYACGNWKKTHVIPEDKSSLSVFGVLRDQVQVINKVLLEDPNNYGENETAWTKAKDMYASCVNMDLIERQSINVTLPLMEEIGGWPVLGSNPGGHWNDAEFDIVSLLVTLRKYNNKPVIDLGVSSDTKNTTQHIIFLDQPDFGLAGRNYFLEERFAYVREAYVVFARTIAILFGADPDTADREMREILAFETDLANITMRKEERRDSEALYNKMTIAELKKNFTEPTPQDTIQFNWYNYISGIMGLDKVDIAVNESEPVVVRAVPYFQKLFSVLQKYSKRTIANYIVWSIMQNRVNNLPRRFLEARDDYVMKISGQSATTARWSDCESYVMAFFDWIVGQKFVMQEFDESAKDSVLEMIGTIHTVFNEILDETDWMNGHTKGLAREKADAIRNQIGFPQWILDVDQMNEMYENYTIVKTEYFQNVLNNLQIRAVEGLWNLRKPYNKNGWGEPPAKVNAFYSPILNTIMFPAGILQPPFYAKSQPKSLNYGGIGVVIGHETTHGFDDEGRQYNKDGDLEQWWDQAIINNFKEKAQCIIDQYGSFFVPEANRTVNGITTQGENIADNGGIKESFRAYSHWVEEQGQEDKLPGVDLTHNQLFFVNFAQVNCNNQRATSAIRQILTDPHSPKQARVNAALQNSPDFAQAFNCPSISYMNPSKKCNVW